MSPSLKINPLIDLQSSPSFYIDEYELSNISANIYEKYDFSCQTSSYQLQQTNGKLNNKSMQSQNLYSSKGISQFSHEECNHQQYRSQEDESINHTSSIVQCSDDSQNQIISSQNSSDKFIPSLQSYHFDQKSQSVLCSNKNYKALFYQMKAINLAIIQAISKVLSPGVATQLNKYVMEMSSKTFLKENSFESSSQVQWQQKTDKFYQFNQLNKDEQLVMIESSRQLSKQFEKILTLGRNSSKIDQFSSSPQKECIPSISKPLKESINKNKPNLSENKENSFFYAQNENQFKRINQNESESDMTFNLTPSKKLASVNASLHDSRAEQSCQNLSSPVFFPLKSSKSRSKLNILRELDLNLQKDVKFSQLMSDNISTSRSAKLTQRKKSMKSSQHYTDFSMNENDDKSKGMLARLSCSQCQIDFTPYQFWLHMNNFHNSQEHKVCRNQSFRLLPSCSNSSLCTLFSDPVISQYTVVLQNLTSMREQISTQIQLISKTKQKIDRQKLKTKLQKDLYKIQSIIKQKQQILKIRMSESLTNASTQQRLSQNSSASKPTVSNLKIAKKKASQPKKDFSKKCKK